jgi:hypothetical protein
VVKVGNNVVKISELISNKPEVLAFFRQDISFPVMPYAWQQVVNKLYIFGFENLPITRIIHQIPKLTKQDPLALRKNVLKLIQSQETFQELQHCPIFPSWEPLNPLYTFGVQRPLQFCW